MRATPPQPDGRTRKHGRQRNAGPELPGPARRRRKCDGWLPDQPPTELDLPAEHSGALGHDLTESCRSWGLVGVGRRKAVRQVVSFASQFKFQSVFLEDRELLGDSGIDVDEARALQVVVLQGIGAPNEGWQLLEDGRIEPASGGGIVERGIAAGQQAAEAKIQAGVVSEQATQ